VLLYNKKVGDMLKNKIIKYSLLIFFIGLIIIGIYNILQETNEYKEANDSYEELEKYIEEENRIDFPKIDFKSLKEINKDVIGWIYSDGMDINYPIVQGSDNDYYLKHLIDGTYNDSGSIFLDYRNKYNFNNKHTIIYGHNMLDGSMFTNLTRYKDQSFYDNNKTYLIMTPYENFVIEVFSGYVASVKEDAWELNFDSDEEFNNWIKTIKEKSIFESSLIPKIGDKLVTLSTCSYELDNARFVLHGILRKEV